MEISENIQCLFSARVEQRDGSYVVEIPARELQVGSVKENGTYRIAVLSTIEDVEATTGKQDTATRRERGSPEPPVEEGELREVEIEDIGDQGDGIARVERGFVIIVPDTEQGERVTVKVTDVQQNVAFADVQERQTHV